MVVGIHIDRKAVRYGVEVKLQLTQDELKTFADLVRRGQTNPMSGIQTVKMASMIANLLSDYVKE